MRAPILLLALTACGDDLPAAPRPGTHVVAQVAMLPLVPARDLDLLVVMDDTIGLLEVQQNLRTHLPALFARLAVVDGELPGLHVGVTTSDLGTTGSSDPARPGPTIGQPGNGGCDGLGDDGALQTFGAPITGAFLTDVPAVGGRARNYEGELAAVVGQQLSAGGGGCAFEQHLRAMQRALTRPEHAGFLRPEAALAILVVADEDDCSLRDAGLLTADTSQLGPLTSFRCTREGVVCDQALDDIGEKTGCRPREDSAYVEGVDGAAGFLEGLRTPDRLVVAGIVSDAAPFALELRAPPGGGTATLEDANVCDGPTLSGGAHAAPRLHDLVARFESRGTAPSICGSDTRVQLLEVARTTKQLLGVACVDLARLADQLDDDGVQPACEAHLISGTERAPLPMCAGAEPCVELVPDDAACPESATHVRVRYRGQVPAGSAPRVELHCDLAAPVSER